MNNWKKKKKNNKSSGGSQKGLTWRNSIFTGVFAMPDWPRLIKSYCPDKWNNWSLNYVSSVLRPAGEDQLFRAHFVAFFRFFFGKVREGENEQPQARLKRFFRQIKRYSLLCFLESETTKAKSLGHTLGWCWWMVNSAFFGRYLSMERFGADLQGTLKLCKNNVFNF